jgi:hypothetical protein
MGALPRPAGVGIEDHASLEDGLEHVADGVVDDPVTEGGGADGASLGIADLDQVLGDIQGEVVDTIGKGEPHPLRKLLRNREQPIEELQPAGGDDRLVGSGRP